MSRESTHFENIPDVGELARGNGLVAVSPRPTFDVTRLVPGNCPVVPLKSIPPFPDLSFAGFSAAADDDEEVPYADLSLLPIFSRVHGGDRPDDGICEAEGASGALGDIDELWRQSIEIEIRRIRPEEQRKREMIMKEEGAALKRMIFESATFFQLFTSFPQKLEQTMREENARRQVCAQYEREARGGILGNLRADLIDIVFDDYQAKIKAEKKRHAQLNAATIKEQSIASYVYYCRNDFQSALQLISGVDFPYSNLRTLVIVTMCRFNCGPLDSLTRLLKRPLDLAQLGESDLHEHAEFFAMVCEITTHLVKQASDSMGDPAAASRNLITTLFELFVGFAGVSCPVEFSSRYTLIDSLEQITWYLVNRDTQLTYSIDALKMNLMEEIPKVEILKAEIAKAEILKAEIVGVVLLKTEILKAQIKKVQDIKEEIVKAEIAQLKTGLALKQMESLMKDLKDLAKHRDALIAYHQQNSDRLHETISGSVKFTCQLNGATFHVAVPRSLVVSLGYFAAHSINMKNVKIQVILALIARAVRKNGSNLSPKVLSRLFGAIQVKATGVSATSVICLQ